MIKVLVICALLALATTTAFPKKNIIGHVPARIVGGSNAKINDFPWQISIQYLGGHHCGGSIYDETTIITAAHCFKAGSNRGFTVVAGIDNLTDFEVTSQTVGISRVIIHEKFSNRSSINDSIFNDIAILKLSKPLKFTDAVQPISLPPKGHTAVGYATITGWGALNEGGYRPKILQKVNVPIMSDEDCKSIHLFRFDSESMICAGLRVGEKGSCRGDSGGPMVAKDLGNGYYLAGIVSWGTGTSEIVTCSLEGYPDVYTEVSNYIDWIQQNS